MTRYAESALKAQSQTHRWWPVRVASRGNGLASPVPMVLMLPLPSPPLILSWPLMPLSGAGEDVLDRDEEEDSSEEDPEDTFVTSQILAVWSAEQVASFLTSGERRIRVMYSLCAEKCVTGTRFVRSKSWISRQTKTLP